MDTLRRRNAQKQARAARNEGLLEGEGEGEGDGSLYVGEAGLSVASLSTSPPKVTTGDDNHPHVASASAGTQPGQTQKGGAKEGEKGGDSDEEGDVPLSKPGPPRLYRAELLEPFLNHVRNPAERKENTQTQKEGNSHLPLPHKELDFELVSIRLTTFNETRAYALAMHEASVLSPTWDKEELGKGEGEGEGDVGNKAPLAWEAVFRKRGMQDVLEDIPYHQDP